jgi:sterol desaturase/sphingolipid hydroxylase (fatty acid hydroxylase superfamily)
MIASLMNFADTMVQTIWPLVAIVALAWVVERRHPIEPGQSRSEILLDYKLALANVVLKRAFAPLAGVIMAMGVNMAGGGFIALRADGWWLPLSLAIVIVTVDLEGYWLHRLQHSVPFMWSMHSMHHSAEAMNAATGARHYWVEQAIIAAFLPSAAMVFKIPDEVLRFVPYFYITEQLAHMNAKIQLGALTLVFNNPQFHRIHHSVEPQHLDKNFCKALPIFDIIFGTAWIPGKDEFPRTGLPKKEKPASFLEGLVWPVRHVPAVRRLLGPVRENPRTIGTPLSSEIG